MPPAPPTFSITTCWPSVSLMRCATTRPIVSCGPPAANGMIMVTGRVGYSCALADPANATKLTSADPTTFLIMDTSVYGRTLRLDAARSRVRTPGAVSQSRTDGRSIDRRTAGLDGSRPFGDLAGQQPGEIIRAAAHRLDDRGAQAFQPPAHPRRVQRLAQSRAEAAHDRLGRAGGKEQGVPTARIEIGEPLLLRGRDLRQDLHSPRRQVRNRLDGG